MVSQLSTFTVHSKESADKGIEQLLEDSKGFVRYVIPSRCKKQLHRELAALGVAEHTLFPDLDALSRTIVDDIASIRITKVAPPQCGGPVME